MDDKVSGEAHQVAEEHQICGVCGNPARDWSQLRGEPLRCVACLAQEVVKARAQRAEFLRVAAPRPVSPEQRAWDAKLELFAVILNSRHLRPRGSTAEQTMATAAQWAGQAWEAFVSVHPLPKEG